MQLRKELAEASQALQQSQSQSEQRGTDLQSAQQALAEAKAQLEASKVSRTATAWSYSSNTSVNGF